MYEYKNEKNPSNQSGGSITSGQFLGFSGSQRVAKVTVEEYFDEDGRLTSKTTTTEYEARADQYPSYTINYDLTTSKVKENVEESLRSPEPWGRSTGSHLHFEI